MKFFAGISLTLIVASALAQGLGDQSIDTLVKKLGSTSFQDRQAATNALQDRPEAARAVRDALRSSDPEVQKRAKKILDYYDRRVVRDLQGAVADGQLDSFIAQLITWPTGKYEEDAWCCVCDISRKLADLHENQGGAKFPTLPTRDPTKAGQRSVEKGGKLKDPLARLPDWVPKAFVAERVTEATLCRDNRIFYIRAGELDIDPRRREPGKAPQNFLGESAAIVTARTARIATAHPQIIFAGGSVDVIDGGAGLRGILIVSSGDVTLKCDLGTSLIIARGKVTATGGLARSRIISGKYVTYNKETTKNCIITENEPNPLGFIRWSDPLKDKPAPKSK